MKEKVTVLLVDDHEVVRLGLMTLLEDIPLGGGRRRGRVRRRSHRSGQ